MRVRSGLNEGMRWIVGSSIHGCWLGHYEIEKQDAVRRLVKPGMKVFDIGANAGFYTVAFSRLVGEDGHVWAFEPLAENVQNLRRHVALNALRNVTVVQAAVSHKAGVSGFALAANNAMGYLSDRSDYVVPTVTVDEMCANLEIGSLDVIKLDVEGAESAVLQGSRQTLSRSRPIVVLATHGREQEQKCLMLLRERGYQMLYLNGDPAEGDVLRSDEVIALPSASVRDLSLAFQEV